MPRHSAGVHARTSQKHALLPRGWLHCEIKGGGAGYIKTTTIMYFQRKMKRVLICLHSHAFTRGVWKILLAHVHHITPIHHKLSYIQFLSRAKLSASRPPPIWFFCCLCIHIWTPSHELENIAISRPPHHSYSPQTVILSVFVKREIKCFRPPPIWFLYSLWTTVTPSQVGNIASSRHHMTTYSLWTTELKSMMYRTHKM